MKVHSIDTKMKVADNGPIRVKPGTALGMGMIVTVMRAKNIKVQRRVPFEG